MKPKNASAGVRESDVDLVLTQIFWSYITCCLDFRSSVAAHKKCITSLQSCPLVLWWPIGRLRQVGLLSKIQGIPLFCQRGDDCGRRVILYPSGSKLEIMDMNPLRRYWGNLSYEMQYKVVLLCMSVCRYRGIPWYNISCDSDPFRKWPCTNVFR